jgi:hypothetical protein
MSLIEERGPAKVIGRVSASAGIDRRMHSRYRAEALPDPHRHVARFEQAHEQTSRRRMSKLQGGA